MTADYTLRFGDFDMSPGSQVEGVSVEAYGLRRGRPVPVTRVIDSMLQDGAVERIDRHDNRDQTIILGFRDGDPEALAAVEDLLMSEVRKQRNELAWTPPSDVAATTVFDILWSDLEFSDADDWDIDELRGSRTWVLTLRALPWARAATETVVPALATSATPTTVTISDGTSATGWTSPYGAVTVASGQLVIPKDSLPSRTTTDSFGNVVRTYAWEATRTLSAVDFTATPYLTLDVDVQTKSTQAQAQAPKVYIDGIQAAIVSMAALPPADPAWAAQPVRCTYFVADSSASSLRVVGTTTSYNSPVGAMLLDNVTRSNVAPAVTTTGREALRTVAVEGSARTQASVEISHPSSPLGRTIVYTCPALAVGGYNPSLGQYRSTVGAGTTDASTLSGKRFSGSSSVELPTFQVPAAMLPKGGYLLYLRARATGTAVSTSFTWTAQTQIGSTPLTAQTGTSAPVTLTSGSSGWQLIPIGGMVLPPTDVSENSAGTVKITIGSVSGTEWDEAFLFYMGDDAALTIVDAGTGTLALGSSHNSMWLCTPTVDSPAPKVLLGLNGDGATSFHAGEKAAAWGIHQFTPGDMTIFVATTEAANAEVSLTYHARYHTHARRSRG